MINIYYNKLIIKLNGTSSIEKMKYQIFKKSPLVLLFTFFLSCATGSIIITGEARAKIDPTEVTLYLDPPAKFETIGIIEASSDIELSRQATQDRVMSELKSQAAKVGANGVLLMNTGSKESGSSGYYSNGIYISSSSETIIAQAKAIYVIEE